MTIYNVRRSVVELIDADSPTAADDELARRLRAAGFEPYEDDFFEAFESEDQ